MTGCVGLTCGQDLRAQGCDDATCADSVRPDAPLESGGVVVAARTRRVGVDRRDLTA